MNIDWYPFFAYNGIYIAFTFIAELLYHKLKVDAFYSRKFIHATAGTASVTYPLYVTSHWTIAGTAFMFLVFLGVTYARGWLKSVNKTESISYGSIIFPIVVYLNFLAYVFTDNSAVFASAMLVFAISDPLAAVSGKYMKTRRRLSEYGKSGKTYLGSFMFFGSAVLIIFFSFFFFSDNMPGQIFLIALTGATAATLAEAFSTNGFDNLTVPLVLWLLYVAAL